MRPLEKRDTDVLIDGHVETTEITVQTSREIVDMLIARIYSDGEATAVRELIANALDAHVEAGIPNTPIDVYLPGSLNPTFTVRDYGNSMSHEFVMKLYSQLGFSSKSNSNDYTGMMGIGSKSPISFSNTFSLKCNDGTKTRNYIIHMNDEGRLVISHTVETNSKDAKGTEVTIPVRGDSISKILAGFRKQQFAWFDKPVNFYGADRMKLDLTEYDTIISLAPGLYMGIPGSKAHSRHLTTHKFVRQGAAVYPLDLGHINLDRKTQTVLQHYFGNSRHLVVDAPIGTLNVTASREALRYDLPTCKNIKELIETKVSSLEKHFIDVVGTAYTAPEALDKLTIRMMPNHESISAFMDARKFYPIVSQHVMNNWNVYGKHQGLRPPDLQQYMGQLPDPSGEIDEKTKEPKLIPVKYYNMMLSREIDYKATQNLNGSTNTPQRVHFWRLKPEKKGYYSNTRNHVYQDIQLQYPNIVITAYPAQEKMWDGAEKLVRELLETEIGDEKLPELQIIVAVVQKKYMPHFERMLEATGNKCFYFTPDDLKEKTPERAAKADKKPPVTVNNRAYRWYSGAFNRTYDEIDPAENVLYVMRKRGVKLAKFEHHKETLILGYRMKREFTYDNIKAAKALCHQANAVAKNALSNLVLIEPDDEAKFTAACPNAINLLDEAARILNGIAGKMSNSFLEIFGTDARRLKPQIRLKNLPKPAASRLLRLINLDHDLRLLLQVRRHCDQLKSMTLHNTHPYGDYDVNHTLENLCVPNKPHTCIEYESPTNPTFMVIDQRIKKAIKRYDETLFYQMKYACDYAHKRGDRGFYRQIIGELDQRLRELEKRPMKQLFTLPYPLCDLFDMEPLEKLEHVNDQLAPTGLLW
jgi:hypothetical protein